MTESGDSSNGGNEIDFFDPCFQEAVVSRAILDLLSKLTDRYQTLPDETTDMDWTAFRALAKAGAAEGIIRSTCTYAGSNGPSTEYYHVRGDYPDVMLSQPILKSEPIEHVLVQARLTTTGIQWAEYLDLENSGNPKKVRGFVLNLIWQAEVAPGQASRVPEPEQAQAILAASASATDSAPGEASDQARPEPKVEEPQERDTAVENSMQFGGPQEDPFDPRVVRWIGKRLYLGPEGSQVRELFMLLARNPGVPHLLGEVQRAVDGMETRRDEQGEDVFRKSMNRIAKALSKLRKHLRENDLDDHVVILKEGPRDEPSYTLVLRFGNS